MKTIVVDDQETHHALCPSGCRDVEDVVVSDVTVRRLPLDPQRVGGGVGDLQVLHSTQRLWKTSRQHQTTPPGVKPELCDCCSAGCKPERGTAASTAGEAAAPQDGVKLLSTFYHFYCCSGAEGHRPAAASHKFSKSTEQ